MNADTVSPALLDYCKKIVQAAADAALGVSVQFSARELENRGREIAQQFVVVYREAGYPLGKTEEGLLAYIAEHTTYDIED